MEELTNVIQINYADEKINRLIKELPEKETSYSRHFTYNENFFIKFDEDLIVPHFPIHHDVRNLSPGRKYIECFSKLLTRLFTLVPSLFSGLTYFFDPGEILRPGFFQLYKIDTFEFLYLLRLDLLFKAQYARIEEQGDNDVTPRYKTNALFLQAYVLPLKEVILKQGRIEAFVIEQKISETWIGEQGRGYLLKGIWIDDELTKFFTKVFLPKGKSIYPYYPFLCMHKTLCKNAINLDLKKREIELPSLVQATQFLSPYMRKIEDALKSTQFSEDLGLFKEIKTLVPTAWDNVFKPIQIKSYLNDNDLKEYKIEQDV